MSPVTEYENSSKTHQFCASLAAGGHYVVRLEEFRPLEFRVHYGLYPDLVTCPGEAGWFLSLEAIQFMGRLMGENQIPGELVDQYKKWLIGIEGRFLSGEYEEVS